MTTAGLVGISRGEWSLRTIAGRAKKSFWCKRVRLKKQEPSPSSHFHVTNALVRNPPLSRIATGKDEEKLCPGAVSAIILHSVTK
jgi:hypothetical protein